jgi:hypothetical protein
MKKQHVASDPLASKTIEDLAARVKELYKENMQLTREIALVGSLRDFVSQVREARRIIDSQKAASAKGAAQDSRLLDALADRGVIEGFGGIEDDVFEYSQPFRDQLEMENEEGLTQKELDRNAARLGLRKMLEDWLREGIAK